MVKIRIKTTFLCNCDFLLFTSYLFTIVSGFFFCIFFITVFVHCPCRYSVLKAIYTFDTGKWLKAPKVKLSPPCFWSQQSLSICNVVFRIWRWSGFSVRAAYRALPVWPVEQKVSSRGIAGSCEQCIWRNVEERDIKLTKDRERRICGSKRQLNSSSKPQKQFWSCNVACRCLPVHHP